MMIPRLYTKLALLSFLCFAAAVGAGHSHSPEAAGGGVSSLGSGVPPSYAGYSERPPEPAAYSAVDHIGFLGLLGLLGLIGLPRARNSRSRVE